MTHRSLSGVERLWLVADRLAPPFVNQLVLEGEGSVDVDRLRTAVASLASWPVCSACLVGSLHRARWVGGGAPWKLREVDGGDWDARSGEGAAFLRDPLPVRTGPLCEVLVVSGDVPRLVLRTHHAFMDGRGTLELAAALFAAARGEAPPPIPLGGPTDADLARRIGGSAEAPVARNCAAPLPQEGPGPGLVWRRLTLDVDPRGLLPRLAWALGEEAEPTRRCRVDIPVDLRRHAPGLRSTANLTGLIRLSVDSHRGRDEPVARLAGELERRLARNEETGLSLGAHGLRRLPLGTLEAIARGRSAGDEPLYGATANLSNVGRLDLAVLSGGGFEARAGFFVPPGSPDLPLFVALTGGPLGVELCGTMPAAFGGGPALSDLLHRLVAALGSSP